MKKIPIEDKIINLINKIEKINGYKTYQDYFELSNDYYLHEDESYGYWADHIRLSNIEFLKNRCNDLDAGLWKEAEYYCIIENDVKCVEVFHKSELEDKMKVLKIANISQVSKIRQSKISDIGCLSVLSEDILINSGFLIKVYELENIPEELRMTEEKNKQRKIKKQGGNL